MSFQTAPTANRVSAQQLNKETVLRSTAILTDQMTSILGVRVLHSRRTSCTPTSGNIVDLIVVSLS